MSVKDRDKKIADILTVFAEHTGKQLSALGISMFIEALKDYPIERIEAAANHLYKTRKWATIPMPADFIDYIDPPENAQIAANEAWRVVLDTIDRQGYVATVQFENPAITQTILAMASSWPEFCNRTRCDDEDFRWLQKEFEQRYAAYAKMPALRNQVLIGWCDAQNGEANPRPALIQDFTRLGLIRVNLPQIERQSDDNGRDRQKQTDSTVSGES